MKNLKVGDKVKSRKTGFYGVVTDVDITPNKLFVKVKLMLNDREVEIPKKRSGLCYSRRMGICKTYGRKRLKYISFLFFLFLGLDRTIDHFPLAILGIDYILWKKNLKIYFPTCFEVLFVTLLLDPLLF